ncbi:MAG: PH domain-containing protein [Candidatus Shapirobacteria bacterium]|jgi:hypothetical protein
MNRSIDLDKVAPDDPVVVKQSQNPPPTPSLDEMRGPETNLVNNNVFEDLKEKIYSITGHTKGPLSSLLINPHVFDFEERDSDEKIVLVARPHWATNISWILVTIMLIIAPSLLKFVPLIGDIPQKFQFMSVLAWYLVTFAFAFEKFLSWYFDVFIITDERVIDIDFNNLLDKKFSEAKLEMIQDITSEVRGVAQTLFNYGTVFVQTAAEVPEITLELVPNPEKIIKVLQVLRDEEEKK